MDLNWIEDFLALASCGNFSRAAEQRHVTQPAFGRRIRALEDWVGATLFDRSSHRIVPTPAGHAFHPAAEEVLRRLNLGGAQAREAAEAANAALRLASTHLLASAFFPRWLSMVELAAGRDFPVQLVVDNMVTCERLMRRGEVRLLLCHHRDDAPAELDARTFRRLSLGHDRLVPVSGRFAGGGPAHAVADGDAPISFLAYRPESGLGRILNRSGLLRRLERRLTPVFHAHAALTLLAVARDGRGVAWIPHSAAAAALAEGSLVPAGGRDWDIPMQISLLRPAARQGTVLEEFWLRARAVDVP